MLHGLSYRRLLLLAFGAIVVLGVVLGGMLANDRLTRSLYRHAERDALERLELLALSLENQPADRLETLLRELNGRAAMHAYMVPRDGLPPSSQPDNPVVAPERLPEAGLQAVRMAGDNGPAVAHGQDPQLGEAVFAARSLRLGPASSETSVPSASSGPMSAPMLAPILVVALPESYIAQILWQALASLLLGAAVALAAGAACAAYVARRLRQQLEQVGAAAQAIGQGDHTRRLRVIPGPEFASLTSAINQMAEGIQAQVLTVTAQKGQLEAILDNMREGVILLGRDGTIRAFNPALAVIFPGMQAVLGKTPMEAFMDPGLQQACQAAIASPASGSEAAKQPRLLQMEPAKGQVYDVGIVPLRQESSGLGAVVVFHDISRLSRLERMRRDFVANVSHELRTPLTSIKGYAETLLGDERLEQRVKPFLETIVRNANHMTKMLADLLNLSRLEADAQPMKPAVVDAASSAASAYRECEVLGKQRAVRLDNRLPTKELWVRADPDRLVQVFRNLLENALRYSPDNGVVTIMHQRRGQDVVLSVSDQGPGVPREEQERIFERFYRVEKHRAKGGGSSGLGLAIAKHIVEHHGGRIWVESPPAGQNEGAAFLFSLPVAQSGAGSRNPTAPREGLGSGSQGGDATDASYTGASDDDGSKVNQTEAQ